MTCMGNMEEISAYVDGEVSGDQALELKKHLATCADCMAMLLAMKEEKGLLKSSFAKMEAPSHLQRSIVNLIEAEARRDSPATARIPFFRRLFTPHPAWALISAVLLIYAGIEHLRTMGVIFPAGEKPTTAGLFVKDITHDSYLVYNLPERPLDIKDDNELRVQDFLSAHVGFTVRIPNLEGAGFILKGGRLWHTVSRISALAEYEDASGNTLSLFEIKGERIGWRDAKEIKVGGRTFHTGEGYGYRGVVWKQSGVALGLVGDFPSDILVRIAEKAASQIDAGKK